MTSRAPLGRGQAWQDALGATPDRWLAKPETRKMLGQLRRRVPLTEDDLRALTPPFGGLRFSNLRADFR